MGKVFLSFLGTGSYDHCNYVLNENKVCEVKYIQDALVQMICSDWGEMDRVVVLTTKEALETHWSKDDGLKKRLEDKKFKCKVDQVLIPKGKTEEEVWEIFTLFYEQIKNDDEVYYDVTHSFRSLPMLGIILLNYGKFLKNISIKGIYYGAFDSLGSREEVKKMAMEDRNAPVFELTSFDNLLDWSVAADNFVNYGNSEKLVKCIKDGSKLLRANKENVEDANLLNQLAINLSKVTDEITTSRGKLIVISDSFVNTKLSINKIKENDLSFKALNPILEKIADKIDKFVDNDIRNGLTAVDWCIKHNMIQQGLTLLEESIVTIIAVIEKDEISNVTYKITDETIYKEQKIREDISSTFHIIGKRIPEDRWKVHDKNLVKSFIKSEIINKLVKSYSSLGDYRNDINHGGFNEKSTSAQTLKDKLKSSYDSISTIINEYLK